MDEISRFDSEGVHRKYCLLPSAKAVSIEGTCICGRTQLENGCLTHVSSVVIPRQGEAESDGSTPPV
jgi:hypothetical protein